MELILVSKDVKSDLESLRDLKPSFKKSRRKLSSRGFLSSNFVRAFSLASAIQVCGNALLCIQLNNILDLRQAIFSADAQVVKK